MVKISQKERVKGKYETKIPNNMGHSQIEQSQQALKLLRKLYKNA